MRFTEVGTPVPTANGNDRELGDDDRGADSGRDFLRRLDAQANVTLTVANDDNGLEARTLTSARLLLHGFDLYPLHQHV